MCSAPPNSGRPRNNRAAHPPIFLIRKSVPARQLCKHAVVNKLANAKLKPRTQAIAWNPYTCTCTGIPYSILRLLILQLQTDLPPVAPQCTPPHCMQRYISGQDADPDRAWRFPKLALPQCTDWVVFPRDVYSRLTCSSSIANRLKTNLQ